MRKSVRRSASCAGRGAQHQKRQLAEGRVLGRGDACRAGDGGRVLICAGNSTVICLIIGYDITPHVADHFSSTNICHKNGGQEAAAGSATGSKNCDLRDHMRKPLGCGVGS